MEENGDGKLGRIALKQVRMTRAQADATRTPPPRGNPMNRCVPYLDLFSRLGDDEVSRLARVPTAVVADLRKQIEAVNKALLRFVDLIPRLSEEELVRLTGASQKTIRFWRLCQPRGAPPGLARASDSGSRPRVAVAPNPKPSDSSPSMQSAPPAARPVATTPSRPHTVPSPSDSSSGVRHHESTAAQSSASMQMANISGDPFPGFEQDFDPEAAEAEPDEIEIGLLEDEGAESEQEDAEFALEDDGDFF